MKKSDQHEKNSNYEVLLLPAIRKRFICLSLICILLAGAAGIFLSVRTMRQSAETACQSASAQISQRVDESLKLLKSLASLPEFYDPQIPWEEKVEKIDKINEQFGYMFICYVDKEIQVYTLGEEPASLASREHMQKLYSTRNDIVTDSFIAGADGVTLNYTVAVPLMMEQEMTGSLFCSIYFDETIKLMEQAATADGVDAILIGSKGQVMSSTNNLDYGALYMDILGDRTLFNTTTDQLQVSLLAREAGSFTSMKTGSIQYTLYGPIKQTNWDILVTADFFSSFLAILPYILLFCVLLTGSMTVFYLYIVRQTKTQAQATRKLLASFHDIEKKLYNSDDVENIDYETILQMSSKGLRDELTGLSTRTFFLNQAKLLLNCKEDKDIITLCFVDLDDLKILNDTYGHAAGDIALQKIGSILREYEKRYDGFAGRYGGDEFILLLKDIENVGELKEVLMELVKNLQISVSYKEEVKVHCSIGACIWDRQSSLDTLISNADKALYDVKRHSKGRYSLFLNGEHVYE